MSYAVDFLSSQPANFITINLGANDLFLLQHECAGVPACIEAGLSAVLQQFGQNVATIYTNIVHTGFHKQLIALTTYSTNYNDPLVTGAVSAIDAVLVQVTNQFGFTVADGFGAFKQASEPSLDPCAAGLLIKLPDGTCNVHPSKLGREVLAGAILRVLRVNEGGNDQGENMQACQGQQ
jgi:lysophospholipase L1-like esterase